MLIKLKRFANEPSSPGTVHLSRELTETASHPMRQAGDISRRAGGQAVSSKFPGAIVWPLQRIKEEPGGV